MSHENPCDKKAFEKVHTMTGYYDGPRSGIVDYQGRPHIYESLFEDAADGPDSFLLQPIDDETFRLAMEDWAIWCRWERAFHSGQTTLATHPALPEERARHEELKRILETRLQISRERARQVTGTFEIRRHGQPELTSNTEWVVLWKSDEAAT